MTQKDLNKIRDFIFKETGIFFESKKDYYLKSRIKQRMIDTGFETFSEYYHNLAFGSRDGEALSLIEELTVNETYFFRDFPQLQGFAEEVLPPYLDNKRAKKDYSLKVWSAACSTGEEPYTLSIIFQEMIEDYELWDVRIDATDIDRRALRHAKLGLYSDRSMKDTPISYRNKYFERTRDGWQVLPNVTEYVIFEQLNLMEHSAMRKRRGYDFIFCRNVLIYFNESSRKKVISLLYDALLSGGYIFLGYSESVGRITAAFILEKKGGFLCYRKP
ncbi:MAG: protein-glutamate O-methyltransferase CheR [Deltaproteobacteria bacterium]|nr:protein-glutamate O-methyltransferase CheR [Deltaproteobacteria bacterium]MBW1928319.1 protein-glutamate O-methyltransferase CheR [Deltaproteobacteria bacterium]MBW2026854.1 protein-glutamate O-methyltransferase CheR [Deltaproteobacteria bacterium]MBW2126834.1 protein-glutamate O-methyltransferase CheR [Deltaproteobacteria bacterium]RLB24261.1 MAG: chemotaxis protein [Deltaproteobacteria bacterium]